MGAQHLPGEEVWVVGEHRSTGERKYYLSNLPADTLRIPGSSRAVFRFDRAQHSDVISRSIPI